MRSELSVSILSQNVRGFKDEKQEELIRRMVKHRFYAACLQETWIAGESVSENDKFLLVQRGIGVQEAKAREGKRGHVPGGVAIVLSPEAVEAWKKAGSEIISFGERIVAVKLLFYDLKKKPVRVFLVSAYSPVGCAAEVVRDQYFADLERCVRACKGDHVLVIGTDANASMGVRSCEGDGVLGNFGEEHVNKAGSELHSFCEQFNRCAATTFFEKHSYSSWFNPRSGLGHQIDHFLVWRKDFKLVRDAGLFGEAALDSDHRPLRLKLGSARNLARSEGCQQPAASEGRRQGVLL